MLAQQPAQMRATRGAAWVAVVIHHAAAGEGLVDLRVQVVAVGEYQEGEVAAQLAVHLAGEHHHRVALASPLGVPEHAQLPLAGLAVPDRLDRAVDAQELVVAGQDLLRFAGGLVEEDEVLQQVQEVALVAHALEQRLHVHRARFFLGQALPFVEVFPLAGDRADLGLFPVAEHHDGVVMEDVGNCVLVVREVLLEGNFQILVDVLALDEQQRQAVDEADDVRPFVVDVAAHPQLAHAEKVIVLRIAIVNHPQPFAHPLVLGVAEGDLHAVADQVVLFAVGGNDGLRGDGGGDLPDGIVVGRIRQAGIQFDELLAQRCVSAPPRGPKRAQADCPARSPRCCRRRPTPSRAAVPGTRQWSAGRGCLRCRRRAS